MWKSSLLDGVFSGSPADFHTGHGRRGRRAAHRRHGRPLRPEFVVGPAGDQEAAAAKRRVFRRPPYGLGPARVRRPHGRRRRRRLYVPRRGRGEPVRRGRRRARRVASHDRRRRSTARHPRGGPRCVVARWRVPARPRAGHDGPARLRRPGVHGRPDAKGGSAPAEVPHHGHPSRRRAEPRHRRGRRARGRQLHRSRLGGVQIRPPRGSHIGAPRRRRDPGAPQAREEARRHGVVLAAARGIVRTPTLVTAGSTSAAQNCG